MAASAVYADQMSVYRHGTALWHPEPDPRDGPVLVGDVGYVRDGAFRRLHNAVAPKDSELNRRGVPEDFRPISLDAREILETANYLTADIYTSESVVKTEFSAEISSSQASVTATASVNFSCASETGALLAFSPSATYKRSEQIDVFKRYYKKNLQSWYRFAQQKGLGLHPDELILVYGVFQTASWANACFTSKDKNTSISISASCLPIAQATISLEHFWSKKTSVQHRSGPVKAHTDGSLSGINDLSDLPENADEPPQITQTIFLRSIRRVTQYGFTKIVAAAEPQDDNSSDDDNEDGNSMHIATLLGSEHTSNPLFDNANTVSPYGLAAPLQQHVSPVLSTPHPCDDMLEYITKHSAASYAIACEDDLERVEQWLCEQDSQSSTVTPGDKTLKSLAERLETHRPTIVLQDDGCGVLQILAPSSKLKSLDQIGTERVQASAEENAEQESENPVKAARTFFDIWQDAVKYEQLTETGFRFVDGSRRQSQQQCHTGTAASTTSHNCVLS